MSEITPWSRQLLTVVISQICKTIGWHSISTASLQVLIDVLHRYLKQMGMNIHDHTTHFNHTLPTLEEVSLALTDMGVNIENLREYADYVAPFPIKTKVPHYPLEKKSCLNFLKPGSREVVTRPFHIHEHLPAMRPELSEGDYTTQDSTNSENSALPALTDISAPSTFEKSGENGDHKINKRLMNVLSQEVGKPVRELKCVMMTTSGFLSPAIKGKVPEARLPKAVHNIVKVENPPPESASVPPVPQSKTEHKKSSHFKSSLKNTEKKNRTIEENHINNKDDNQDEIKVKKVDHTSHTKEASKLKVLKPIANTPVESVPDSPAIIRQEILKLKGRETSSQKEPKPPKQTKAEKKLEKIQQEKQIVVTEKLTTEPNKQKLNIFRRISKVKEERVELPTPKQQDDKIASINESIENVVRNIGEKDSGRNTREKENPPMDSEDLQYLNKQQSNSIKKLKRKKKKKKVRDGEPSAKKMKLNNESIDKEIEHPKPVVPEQPLPYPFFTQLPDSLGTNYLIPRLTNPFLNMTKLDPNCPHPEMPNLPLPPPMIPSTFADNQQKSPAKNVKVDKALLDSQLSNISDKKLKKKLKKDKREKDKKKREKKEKFKLKKEKLEEKKQEKLLKKEKNKEKVKKKKKLNIVTQKEETTEDPSVPKIKLRIGGTNSPLPSPSGIQSPKINVSIVKPVNVTQHGETFIKDIREPSPELAKMPALVGKPVKMKNQPKIIVESVLPVPKQVVEPITLSTKGKKASVVNAETKLKNKEKSAKSKKTDSHKSKPTPFYYDAEGNQVWICPTCSHPDDGSPMIGCDGCDAWYHWVCVGITSAPESVKWFCRLCIDS